MLLIIYIVNLCSAIPCNVFIVCYSVDYFLFRSNITGPGAGMCGSSYHPNSLEKSCDDSGNRRVDWFGLIIVFLGIVFTGVGNSVFYSFGIAYLVS